MFTNKIEQREMTYSFNQLYKDLRQVKANWIRDFRAMAHGEMLRAVNSKQLLEKIKDLRESPIPRTVVEAKEMFAAIKRKQKC